MNTKERATPTTEATPKQRANYISQQAQVLAALQAGDRLTPLNALARFGDFRLAATIHRLRRSGYLIPSRLIKVPGRDGRDKRVAEYWMEPGHAEPGSR